MRSRCVCVCKEQERLHVRGWCVRKALARSATERIARAWLERVASASLAKERTRPRAACTSRLSVKEKNYSETEPCDTSISLVQAGCEGIALVQAGCEGIALAQAAH